MTWYFLKILSMYMDHIKVILPCWCPAERQVKSQPLQSNWSKQGSPLVKQFPLKRICFRVPDELSPPSERRAGVKLWLRGKLKNVLWLIVA